MVNHGTQAAPVNPGYVSRPGRRRGRKPKGSAPVVVVETPDRPDPSHVLTWRQRRILQVIRDSVLTHGYPPSMREIADAVGLTSTSSVLYQLSILQRTGYLRRDVGRARTMEVRLPGALAVRPESAAASGARDDPDEAALSGRELIAVLASRRAELGLSQEEVARRMQTSPAAVARLEAQLAALVRYTEALGLLAAGPRAFPRHGHIRRVHPVGSR